MHIAVLLYMVRHNLAPVNSFIVLNFNLSVFLFISYIKKEFTYLQNMV